MPSFSFGSRFAVLNPNPADFLGEQGTVGQAINFYLPSSSSAPPVTPAFHSSWLSTAGATRMIGTLGKKAGTSLVSATTAATAKLLVYQYVISLRGTSVFAGGREHFSALSTYPLVYGRPHTSAQSVTLRTVIRVVDAAGNNTWPADRTLSVHTTNGSKTMTSAGLFLPSDVFRWCRVYTDNNWVQAYVDASTLTLAFAANNTLSPGALNLSKYKPFQMISASFTGSSLLSRGIFFDEAGQLSVPPLANTVNDSHYLVVEVGTGNNARAIDIEVGDPSDTIATDGGSSGSCGGQLFYGVPSPSLFLT